MSGKLNLALAVIALQHGNKDDCLSYMAKAAEFGDDLTQFVSEIMRPAPTAARNEGSTPQAENTIAPSLAATASTSFITLTNRMARTMAIASSLDDGDELDAEMADEAFDDDFDLEFGPNGVDEDEEDEDDEEEDMEAVASVGPIRYKV